MLLIKIKKCFYLIIFLIIAGIFSISFILNKHTHSVSYWLWAGITAKDAPPSSELYVYQGLIKHTKKHGNYQRFGLYPYPLKSKKLYFVYRLQGNLPEPKYVVSIFKKTIQDWQRHSITPDGLQLDFDSPTSKLGIYSNFLKKLREYLPEKYALSITGLGDWTNAHRQVMQSIIGTTDEIVFQLYQGKKPLIHIEHYIKRLKNYPLPFKVGLLPQFPNQVHINNLKENSNFKGIIYFIQRTS